MNSQPFCKICYPYIQKEKHYNSFSFSFFQAKQILTPLDICSLDRPERTGSHFQVELEVEFVAGFMEKGEEALNRFREFRLN